MPIIDLTDPAAKFIHDNALRSLRDFTFRREVPLKKGDDENAFYVIDTDYKGRVTFDTRDSTPQTPQESSSSYDPRQVLFSEVVFYATACGKQ